MNRVLSSVYCPWVSAICIFAKSNGVFKTTDSSTVSVFTTNTHLLSLLNSSLQDICVYEKCTKERVFIVPSRVVFRIFYTARSRTTTHLACPISPTRFFSSRPSWLVRMRKPSLPSGALSSLNISRILFSMRGIFSHRFV